MATVNISIPDSMYIDAKKVVVKKGYASLSELVRDTLRKIIYPEVTENGFTPEFEEEVLKAAAEPIENDREWDGKGSFVDFALGREKDDKNKIVRKIHRRT